MSDRDPPRRPLTGAERVARVRVRREAELIHLPIDVPKTLVEYLLVLDGVLEEIETKDRGCLARGLEKWLGRQGKSNAVTFLKC